MGSGMSETPKRARRRGRRRQPGPLVEIPIKLKLRASQHSDVIDFFNSVPSGGRAATVVTLARAYLSGQMPGRLGQSAASLEPAAEEEIYATLKDLL